jgi:predicted nuclease with TOPRIM domain
MELLQVPELTARQTQLKAQLSELEKLKSEINYLRLNEDPTGYQEQSKFLERYAEQLAELAKKADGYKRLTEGWQELEAHYGSPEKLYKALCELATAEAHISHAKRRNQELERAFQEPEKALLAYAKYLVLNNHPAKSVRHFGQGYLDCRLEEIAYAYGITTERADAKARQLIKDTRLSYNARSDRWTQTLSV